jgi:tripartite-type tricarboxylate transporter receptor subunit TctC
LVSNSLWKIEAEPRARLAIEAVVKSPADAFLSTPSLSVVIVPQLREVPFDPLKDLVPVTQFVEGTLLVAIHPSVPVNSIQELAAYAKQNPGTGAHPASARTDI